MPMTFTAGDLSAAQGCTVTGAIGKGIAGAFLQPSASGGGVHVMKDPDVSRYVCDLWYPPADDRIGPLGETDAWAVLLAHWGEIGVAGPDAGGGGACG